MSFQKNSSIVLILTIISAVLTVFQPLVPTLPGLSDLTLKITGASVMFLLQSVTLVKQYLSVEINNKSTQLTWAMVIVSILGFANEFVTVIPFSPFWSQLVIIVITVATGTLNLLSKIIWSTEETRSKI